MRYKDKNDIDWNVFSEFTDAIDGVEPNEIAIQIHRFFYIDLPFSDTPVNKFLKVLERPSYFNHVLKIDLKTIGQFIDADNYLKAADYTNLLPMFVKPRWHQRKVKCSVTNVQYAVPRIRKAIDEIKEQYPWIYNPPAMPTTSSETTIGSVYRQDFVEHYGSYMEFVYLICKGDFLKLDEVMKWEPNKFLFLAEYLNRKKITENIK